MLRGLLDPGGYFFWLVFNGHFAGVLISLAAARLPWIAPFRIRRPVWPAVVRRSGSVEW